MMISQDVEIECNNNPYEDKGRAVSAQLGLRAFSKKATQQQ